MHLGQYGRRQHGAYEVSPFHYGRYSLTAGMGGMGGRVVPISGKPAPFYWGDGDDYLNGLGQSDEAKAAQFGKLHSQILRYRAQGKEPPSELALAYQEARAFTPGAQSAAIPVKLVPHEIIRAKGTAGFLQWFRLHHPILFRRLEREHPELLVSTKGMHGLGQNDVRSDDPVLSQAPASSGWTTTMFSFLDKVLANQREKNMAEVNLELARQGYAPVGFVEQAQAKAAEIAASYQALPQPVQIGAPLLLIAGGGALLYFLMR
jgi:hypothetical protein